MKSGQESPNCLGMEKILALSFVVMLLRNNLKLANSIFL